MSDYEEFQNSTNAALWAENFVRIIRAHCATVDKIDEGFMIGWFANAIETGRMAGAEEERKRSVVEKLNEMSNQVAGATASIFMEMHPHDVMPTDKITEAVDRVLQEFGVPGYDYGDSDSDPNGKKLIELFLDLQRRVSDLETPTDA